MDAWLAEHGVGDGFFMLSSATPLKTNGEEDCKTPIKANLALDTPKPLKDLGSSPKQIYTAFKKNQEAAFEGGGGQSDSDRAVCSSPCCLLGGSLHICRIGPRELLHQSAKEPARDNRTCRLCLS